MLARLWWKEYRSFRAAWAVLFGAAGLLQWLLLRGDARLVDAGGLMASALGWAVLYAFACGAAAFSGEREAKTLGFLDALPVGRWTLWTGKVTFALASTAGFALLLAGLASLGISGMGPRPAGNWRWVLTGVGVVTFEGLAWGLFWSSLLKNPLPAGALAVVSVAAFLFPRLDMEVGGLGPWRSVPGHLGLAILALGASGVVMTWRPRWRSAGAGLEDVPSHRADRPIVVRGGTTGRSLLWQDGREGRTALALAILIGLAFPVASWLQGHRQDPLALFLAVVATLLVGVGVFGTDGLPGSRRFLVEHGVSPGSAWGWKMVGWGLAVAPLLASMAFLIWLNGEKGRLTRPGRPEDAPFVAVAILLDTFAIALLCGMASRRRITAALVAVIGLVAIVPAQMALYGSGMIPLWSLFLTPAALVVVSRLWAADWLFDREGWARWLRLGGLLAAPTVALAASYISYRAFDLPDSPAPYDRAALAVAPPADRDAAPLYHRLYVEVEPDVAAIFNVRYPDGSPVDRAIAEGWDRAGPAVVAWWEKNRGVIDRIREASKRPKARFEAVESMSFATKPNGGAAEVDRLAGLVALDARERQSRGDLAGAWDDILALFRIADQLASSTPTISQMLAAGHHHHRAVGLAFEWLADPRQTPALAREALADLRALPPLPGVGEAIRVESSIVDRTLDLPGEEIERAINQGSRREQPVLERFVVANFLLPAWERIRARRVSHPYFARVIDALDGEPFERPSGDDLDELSRPDFGESPLARLLIPAVAAVDLARTREVVGRRALELAVAIRAWELEHDGEAPATLDALVPGLLARLPLDPYSGQPFRYLKSDGRSVMPPIRYDDNPNDFLRPTRVGQPLIYSVGPDRDDDGGRLKSERPNRFRNGGDIPFAVP